MGQLCSTEAAPRRGYEVGDLDRPAGERWVTISNALTRAGHGLTLASAWS